MINQNHLSAFVLTVSTTIGTAIFAGDVGVILRVGNQDLLLRVPEPGSLALLGASLIGLGIMRRRTRRPN